MRRCSAGTIQYDTIMVSSYDTVVSQHSTIVLYLQAEDGQNGMEVVGGMVEVARTLVWVKLVVVIDWQNYDTAIIRRPFLSTVPVSCCRVKCAISYCWIVLHYGVLYLPIHKVSGNVEIGLGTFRQAVPSKLVPSQSPYTGIRILFRWVSMINYEKGEK